MKNTKRAIFGLLGITAAGVMGWLFWGMALPSMLATIPEGDAFGWVFKLGCTIFVGWFGGIIMPFMAMCMFFTAIPE